MKLEYTVVLEPDQEEGGYTVTVPVLPGCISQGDTLEETLENIKEAIELYLDSCRKAGEEIPVEKTTPQLEKIEVII
ncbi:MAG: type II toxin-antitoxin system HicB family antitoxin [Dehalococcoidia bacterium]|nr:type II toxin-antitoxin system HicB family antitoxin [Dehalococcoidia bacterium]